MSGNWDDSDSEDDNVVVVEKPIIIPRARQPSIAKSLEKVAILESSVAGSIKDVNDSDSDIDTVSEADSADFYDSGGTVITLDFGDSFVPSQMQKMISSFPVEYRNIVSEFADVEIFLISLDSLIIECLAHKYHNWTLAGQTLVLTKQLDRFLQQFVNLGGKFKLVVFTDLSSHFVRDTTLAFARASAIAHIASGPHAKDLEYFTSPVDSRWQKFLMELTPSFLMISTDNVTSDMNGHEDVNVSPQLETIVLDALSNSIPIVPLTSIVANFASVSAYYITPELVVRLNWDSFVAAHWDCNSELLKLARSPSMDISDVKSPAELWANIILQAKQSGDGDASEHFDALCCAILLSSIICTRRGADRVYIDEKTNGKRGLDVIRDRRRLLNTATSYLERANLSKIKFSLSDLWDGRMIIGLFDAIVDNESILPYRLQEEFAKVHLKAGLTKPLAVDTAEKLFEAIPQTTDPLGRLPILYKINSALLDAYIPEMKRTNSANIVDDKAKLDYAIYMQEHLSWKFKPIEDDVTKKAEKIEDEWQLKRANKARQFLSRWYEMFANSLEGRVSNLLVDFSRTPRGFAVREDEAEDEKKKGANKAWVGQKGSGGGKKAGKEPAKSKKDLILEANKKAKDTKIIDGERVKIKFATQQGKNAIQFLENLYSSLDLPESKALCGYEMTIREGKELLTNWTGAENKIARRVECVRLVGHLKACFVKHWQYLEDKQKEQIVDIWVSLGFEAPAGTKPSADAKTKKLDVDLNMVYYQLEYGGELIDIQSDPQKDDRVTGFAPDAWQRRMLNSVDIGNSAVIVAPTSAGKTFVSYYCIEKVLRQSDDDVVVYVSPSKALINQVCGSVYARFRNKAMTRGKSLFGTLLPEYGQNALSCQVLVTVPECLENLILSTNPIVQEFISHVKYVVFDEVHSIGASDEAHIWEHLLLLIRCPFLALSATIGNASKLHEWLNSAEEYKTDKKRKVDFINYGERYSELELAILQIEKPQLVEKLLEEKEEKTRDQIDGKPVGNRLAQFMPYGVYMSEKLRMFGIPDDQQLTARQILQLYTTLAAVDEKTKKEFEPCTYFKYKSGTNVWLSRADLRKLENGLKKRFLEWLESDEDKMQKVLKQLGEPIKEQLDHRAVPFNKESVAKENIVPLIDEMREKAMLPAICFNDDRHVCEMLATQLTNELEARELEFMESNEFKTKYAIKDEDKMMKQAKRKRDAEDKKKKKKNDDEDKGAPMPEVEESDPFAMQRARLKQVLERFRLRGRGGGSQDIYEKMVERMQKQAKGRESSKELLRMFERGIGYHHAGLNMAEKGAVEVLYRAGHLAIIFSTSTLALGVNMPCKTVVFGVDTRYLTPLLYRQMSGRAGRRGFDHSGTVVFLSVPTSKMRRLLTASLSTLQGNPPFTSTFLLRLLAFVHQKPVEGAPLIPGATLEQRALVARTVLENSFALFTRKQSISGDLQKQLRLYVAFSVQMLRHLQLLDEHGAAKNLAGLVMSLGDNDPGSLFFAHLLQKGCFHLMMRQHEGSRADLKLIMLNALAMLFTRIRSNYRSDRLNTVTPQNSKIQIVLKKLPKEMQKVADELNETVSSLYKRFMQAISPNNHFADESYSIAGGELMKKSLDLEVEFLSPVQYEGYSHDNSFLPIIPFSLVDHRGKKVLWNAFAVDFYIHESRQLLQQINDIKISSAWQILHDFIAVLEKLSNGLLCVSRAQDPVCELIREIYVEYDSKFRSAFGMKSKD